MIQISSLPFRQLVIAELSGFLSVQDVADLERQKVAAARAMGLGSGEFDLLVDTTRCDIQPQDVIVAFQSMIANTPCRARNVALVRATSLARMQAQRALNRENVALVDSRTEALDWLSRASMAAA